MAILDVFIVNVAIPSISKGLGASFSEIELVIASYTLAYAALVITGGRLGDLYGYKHLFMIGIAGFTLASALSSPSSSSSVWAFRPYTLDSPSFPTRRPSSSHPCLLHD